MRDSKNGNKEQNNRLSLNTDNKYTAPGGGGGKNNLPVSSASSDERNSEKEDKDVGTEKDKRNSDKNGALHQCISELAASIASNEDNIPTDVRGNSRKMPTSEVCEKSSSSKTTSHFVTVIEVKESKINMDQNNPSLSKDPGAEVCSDHITSTFSSFERKPSAPPLSPSMSSSSHASAAAAMLEAKKKNPPR